MLNKIILQGRLCADPELRHTPGGTAVCNFRLAVDRDFKSEGQSADFIPCIAWKATGETITRFLTKGSMVLVEGRLSSRTFEQNGQKRNAHEVIVERFNFCESKKSGTQAVQSAAPKQAQPFTNVTPDFEDDGELPW